MALYAIAPPGPHADRRGELSPMLEPSMPLARVKQIVAVIVLAFSAILIFLAIDGLTMNMRLTLAVFVATITAWTILDLPDTPVALAGAALLPVVGAIDEDVLYRSLGNDIVWLMLAAFVVAGVLRQVGVIEQIIRRLLARLATVQGLFWTVTLLIFATAFIIPSTSARAAMLAPVYLGLSAAIDNARINRALALLFPSVILLSAGASLIGAGAHLVAAGMMERLSGQSPDFLHWIALAGPFSLLCSLLACAVLLRFFLTREERAMTIAPQGKRDMPTSLTRQQWTVLAITGAMILLFAAQPLHGIGMPLIGIAAALLLATERISGLALKAALKGVEWNLLLFLAGTLVIGEALIETGTANVLAERVVGLAGSSIAAWPALVIGFAAVVATLSHLAITSRTARATVLIPALALPLAALGVDPLNLVMVVTLASGFCQTLMVSAKPVALFGAMDPPPFGQGDLLRLAMMLVVPFMVLLVVFATLVWPLQGLPLR
ncbi:anion permease [Neorhizobium galegae]|uniref:SLC13 family permease n=1 Tax=Neorhizobium galegae TaxID=399 RepID=UPI000620FC2D|nr:SLC13 family permease [Neorhizobium galegae]MCQ1775616.1 anion permease [Neorhizobium galegae]MCQ1798116.1 anion permease [Neorhizobium galegae]CDZ29094.1 Divalent anion:Na+ symporter (DASS) family transporter [Neorhizobium galegae bv. officinalis]